MSVPVPLKATVHRWLWPYRFSTNGLRALPDFIIIGAQKSGTSSLFNYLRQHPQLVPSYRKEVHFFDGGLDPQVDTYAKGEAWYRAHFPLKTRVMGDAYTFEASPLYLYNPLVAERIFKLTPHVKLIALLRNPTERAISHYFHEERQGREPLPIAEALAAENQRLEDVLRDGNYKHPNFIHCSYKSRGLYKKQLDRFFERFPREQILCVSSEGFFSQPEQSLERIFRFLEVDAAFRIKDLQARNVSSNRTPVDAALHAELDAFFRPHNAQLYALLGEDYAW